MYVRCPSQRDAEDWVRCFAQIYEEEDFKCENELEKIKEDGVHKGTASDYVKEEAPK